MCAALVFTHVLMAIVSVGGVLVTRFYVLLATRAEDLGRRMQLLGDISWIGLHVFVPAAFVLVIAGVAQVVAGALDLLGLVPQLSGESREPLAQLADPRTEHQVRG